MASTRHEILARLRAAKAALQAEFPLKRLALFGSYARDTQIRGQSDVDILVEVDPSIGLEFVTLAERLEQLLGERVDLVSRRAIKPSLWPANRAGTNRCLNETPTFS
jgi:predicted nucleotidyltransferase